MANPNPWEPIELWLPILRGGGWASGEEGIANVIPPLYNSAYSAHACHLCKRGGFCNTPTKLLRCGGCRFLVYCGADHQKQDWKAHKPLCKLLSALHQARAADPLLIPSPAIVAGTSGANISAKWKEFVVNGMRWLSAHSLEQNNPIRNLEMEPWIKQPHCQACLALQGDTHLIECERCHGVALCSKCSSAAVTASGRLPHDKVVCDTYILWLGIFGMIGEQGNALCIPSLTPCSETERTPFPKDWFQYWAEKRSDFEVPAQLIAMGPVCFLSIFFLCCPSCLLVRLIVCVLLACIKSQLVCSVF